MKVTKLHVKIEDVPVDDCPRRWRLFKIYACAAIDALIGHAYTIRVQPEYGPDKKTKEISI